jgi:hypothetical protein
MGSKSDVSADEQTHTYICLSIPQEKAHHCHNCRRTIFRIKYAGGARHSCQNLAVSPLFRMQAFVRSTAS